ELPEHLNGAVALTGEQRFRRPEEEVRGRFAVDAFFETGEKEDGVAALLKMKVVLPGGVLAGGVALRLPVKHGRADRVVLVAGGRGEVALLLAEGDEVQVNA